MDGGVGGGLFSLSPPLRLSFIHPPAPRRRLHRPRRLYSPPHLHANTSWVSFPLTFISLSV